MAYLGVYTANRKIKHMIDNEIAQQTTKGAVARNHTCSSSFSHEKNNPGA